MRTIKSRSHDYTVEEHASSAAALAAVTRDVHPHFLVDRAVHDLLDPAVRASLPTDRLVLMEASEAAKSYGPLEPVFLDLLGRGLRRNGLLVVVGGGVLQDAGCFIASVLARGIRWELVPTTLLAQADSCIGSKSSINIGPYKNQIGTFYPPHRVLLVQDFLRTLPFDEIRSGLGEVIKLQLLSGEQGFEELMADLEGFATLGSVDRLPLLARWVQRSMDVKQPVIERDEFDRGERLLLNYGHTFGHAFESVTDFGIPHGIAVVLGMLAATSISARLGMVTEDQAGALARRLRPWHEPYAERLADIEMADLLAALARDKKNTAAGLTCILTRGFGRMERTSLSQEQVYSCVIPALSDLIHSEFGV
jgi:3-dehydroquinate synthase